MDRMGGARGRDEVPLTNREGAPSDGGLVSGLGTSGDPDDVVPLTADGPRRSRAGGPARAGGPDRCIAPEGRAPARAEDCVAPAGARPRPGRGGSWTARSSTCATLWKWSCQRRSSTPGSGPVRRPWARCPGSDLAPLRRDPGGPHPRRAAASGARRLAGTRIARRVAPPVRNPGHGLLAARVALWT